jgi:methyl-accepting chemotaxis protein
MAELSGRLEVLLEQIRDAISEQAESTSQINNELNKLNLTMQSINAYLAQLASRD